LRGHEGSDLRLVTSSPTGKHLFANATGNLAAVKVVI
jgi:hypothetical protein